MKKIGHVQMVALKFNPSVYIFDEIRHKLIFNRIINESEIQLAIGELGREASAIRNIRAVAASSGSPETLRDLEFAEKLVSELTHIYYDVESHTNIIKNGSGKLIYGCTEVRFVKPRMVEFDYVQN